MTPKKQRAPDQAEEKLKSPPTVELQVEPAPEELTGRSTGTDDDLSALFQSKSGDHLADGFKGGSDDDVGVAIVDDDYLIEPPQVDTTLE